jgi:hypothetical protein
MNEYKNPETMKSVIEYIEDDGDAVFREVFRNRLWVPIGSSAALVVAAVAQMLAGTDLVETALDVALTLTLIGVVWWLRYARAEVTASESKYAHAMSYLDSLEDEPDA